MSAQLIQESRPSLLRQAVLAIGPPKVTARRILVVALFINRIFLLSTVLLQRLQIVLASAAGASVVLPCLKPEVVTDLIECLGGLAPMRQLIVDCFADRSRTDSRRL